VGQAATITATVSDTTNVGTVPTGSVTFSDSVAGSLNGGAGVTLVSGVASLTGVILSGSAGTSHTITANYQGVEDTFLASSNTATAVLAAAPTTTGLGVAPSGSVVAGTAVTFTGTVSPAPTGSPAGTVSFYNGETLLGSGPVNSSGIATFITSSLPTGVLSLTAVYSGNTGFAASTSAAVIETVTSPSAATTTTLTATPNPAIVGQAVTLTATVAPAPTGTPAGTVSFYSGTTLLAAVAVNSSGIAAFTTSSLPAGALILTAVYSGNAGFAPSTSSALTEMVTAPAATATTTTLTASPNPLADGQPATFTATVTPAPTGGPAGIISFYSGTTLLGTGTLSASGVATYTTSSLAAGADSITAVYPGNAGFAPSTSPPLSETVNTAYTVTGPATPVAAAPGGAATFNLSVPPLGGPFDGLVTLSATGLPPGATATFNPPTVTPGSLGAPTVLTIQLPALTANNSARDIPARHTGFPSVPFSLGFVLFGAVLGRKRIPKTLVLVLALASLGVAMSLVTGCGGGFATTPLTPAGNYTITVTGTSGSFQASTTVTLVVQ
jgi:hypothetical protein